MNHDNHDFDLNGYNNWRNYMHGYDNQGSPPIERTVQDYERFKEDQKIYNEAMKRISNTSK